MDIKEFAEQISGKEYGYPQFTEKEIKTARENGFVIVYGASDDLMEFDGAIEGESDCFDGGSAWISRDRVSEVNTCVGDKEIKAVWCGGEKDESGNEITWTYETDIPHETFMIYESGIYKNREPYCRGIVFSVDDVIQSGN